VRDTWRRDATRSLTWRATLRPPSSPAAHAAACAQLPGERLPARAAAAAVDAGELSGRRSPPAALAHPTRAARGRPQPPSLSATRGAPSRATRRTARMRIRYSPAAAAPCGARGFAEQGTAPRPAWRHPAACRCGGFLTPRAAAAELPCRPTSSHASKRYQTKQK
jgi:hypothetical protein